MTNKNKLKLLISTIVILLPSLAALILKDQVKAEVRGAWHFSWILPVMLVLFHVVLHLITFRENERVEQNKKIVNITYWIIPAMSVYISSIFIMLSLGFENVIGLILCAVFGTMFLVFGNFMPKSVQNRTFGIKIKWTLANEENWAATHRFAGKVWVCAGILVLLCAFLPEIASIILMIAVCVPACAVPIVYSYRYYKKQLQNGTATKDDFESYTGSKLDKKSSIAAVVIGGVIVALVVVLMFVGNINYTVGDGALDVNTTFGGGMTLEYEDIESVELREEAVPGMRVSGFASSKLLYGWFKNDELGSYTRYTYTKSEVNIVIRTNDGIVVLGSATADDTRALYESLITKIPN